MIPKESSREAPGHFVQMRELMQKISFLKIKMFINSRLRAGGQVILWFSFQMMAS